jgi:hypothetical protein
MFVIMPRSFVRSALNFDYCALILRNFFFFVLVLGF